MHTRCFLLDSFIFSLDKRLGGKQSHCDPLWHSVTHCDTPFKDKILGEKWRKNGDFFWTVEAFEPKSSLNVLKRRECVMIYISDHFPKKKYSPKSSPNCTQGSPLHFFKKFLKNNKKNTSQRNQLSTCFFVQMSNFSAKNLERHGFWTDFSKFWVSFYFSSQFEAISGPLWPIVTQCDPVWNFGRFPLITPHHPI